MIYEDGSYGSINYFMCHWCFVYSVQMCQLLGTKLDIQYVDQPKGRNLYERYSSPNEIVAMVDDVKPDSVKCSRPHALLPRDIGL